jgi:hypothetical protein
LFPTGLSNDGVSNSEISNLFPYLEGESVEHEDSYPKLLFKCDFNNDLF